MSGLKSVVNLRPQCEPGDVATGEESLQLGLVTPGEFSSIIANHVTQGPDVMTVKSSDGAIQFVGGCQWKVG